MCEQVVGTFVNGRVEIFIPYHPLRDAQLSQPRIASAVAARLAQLHAVQIDEPRIGEVFNLLHRWCASAVASICRCHRYTVAIQPLVATRKIVHSEALLCSPSSHYSQKSRNVCRVEFQLSSSLFGLTNMPKVQRPSLGLAEVFRLSTQFA